MRLSSREKGWLTTVRKDIVIEGDLGLVTMDWCRGALLLTESQINEDLGRDPSAREEATVGEVLLELEVDIGHAVAVLLDRAHDPTWKRSVPVVPYIRWCRATMSNLSFTSSATSAS